MERKELLMLALIALLFVSTAIQTIALATMTNSDVIISTQSTTGNSAPSSSSSNGNSGSSGVPANLKNLPNMVGGC